MTFRQAVKEEVEERLEQLSVENEELGAKLEAAEARLKKWAELMDLGTVGASGLSKADTMIKKLKEENIKVWAWGPGTVDLNHSSLPRGVGSGGGP